MLRLLIVMLSICFSSCLFGQVIKYDTPPKISHRLIIVYQEKAEATELKKGETLHKKYGGELKEHLKNYPADLVQFPKTLKEEELKRICSKYEKSPFIKNCHLDQEIRPDNPDCDGEECEGDDAESALDKFLQALEKLLEKSQPCNIFPLHGQKRFWKDGQKYSPFWAQEYVGVDLAKEEMRDIPWAQEVPVAILDAGYHKEHINLSTSTDPYVSRKVDEHGTAVANIINGKGPYGASEKVDYLNLELIYFGWDYFFKVNKLLRAKKAPKIISNSMTWGYGVSDPAKKISKKGTIWVKSAGNEYPEKISKEMNNAPIIMVGSMDPNGFQSHFSQESDSLTILAPSGDEISSIGKGGKHISFGGTSGATPLVSGSLANALALIPDITLDEAKTLLRKTALPNLNPSKNSAGILNSYKLFKVAERIALKCGYDKKGDPKEKSKCKEDAIKDDKTYTDFIEHENMPALYAELATAFPDCFQRKESITQTYSCDKKIELLNKVRKMAFLEPDNSSYWEKLSCVSNLHDFKGNGDYYSNLSLFAQREDSSTNKDLLKEIVLKRCYSDTYAIREFEKVFNQEDWTSLALKMLTPPRRYSCVYTASGIINRFKVKSPEIHQTLKEMATNEWSAISRKHGLAMLAHNYPDDPETKKRLMLSVYDPDESVRTRSLDLLAVNYPEDTEIHQLLIEELRDENEKVRRAAAQALGVTKTSNPEVHQALVDTMLNSSDQSQRFDAIQSLGQITPKDPKIHMELTNLLKDDKEEALHTPILWTMAAIKPNNQKIHLAIAKSLQTDNVNKKLAAVNALKAIAPTNSYVIHQLRRIRGDKNKMVRKAVSNALKEIDK